MHVDTPPQSKRVDAHLPADVRLDSVPSVGSRGTDFTNPHLDTEATQCLRSPEHIGAKRGRGRPKLARDGAGNVIRGATVAVGQPAPQRVDAGGWLGSVQAQLEKADGLTDGHLPVKLAKAVCEKAASMPVLDVVAAFEKCENMALKLKAAKFLKDTSKGTIEELRKYAMDLMTKEESDETPQ